MKLVPWTHQSWCIAWINTKRGSSFLTDFNVSNCYAKTAIKKISLVKAGCAKEVALEKVYRFLDIQKQQKS